MRFEILLMAILPVLALANLHRTFMCYDKAADLYLDDATNKACDAYKARNTGTNQWDQCPDCTINKDKIVQYCESNGWHLGGDEITYYCKMFGASASYAWNN